MDDATRIACLKPPKAGKIAAVLDTDTYNEVDDQFALIYMLLSERIDLQGVFAAPYSNHRSTGPADGMEKSYNEILKILGMFKINPEGYAFRGSDRYMAAKNAPVESASARRLVEMAKQPRDQKLYVLTIGCATNVASAILMEPSIIDNIIVVWLGGHPRYWPDANEFNLMQDVYAAQVLLNSGVPLVRFPCAQVTEQVATSIPELVYYLSGTELGDYLIETVKGFAPQDPEELYCWSKVIWDIVSVAWLDLPEAVSYQIVPTPRLVGDHTTPKHELCFAFDYRRPLCTEAVHVNRDMIFRRLFRLINNV